MKIILFVFKIVGITMLIIRLLGVFLEIPFNNLMLFLGIALLILAYMLSYFIYKYRPEKKIYYYRKPSVEQKDKLQKTQKNNSKIKGWGMNNSPFRERKSGVTWGGGNIHGANASRGSRKSFLR